MDKLKNEDPDKYYILLDTKNEIVTVFERDETGQYTRIVRRFLCSSGRTDVDETDPEDGEDDPILERHYRHLAAINETIHTAW